MFKESLGHADLVPVEVPEKVTRPAPKVKRETMKQRRERLFSANRLHVILRIALDDLKKVERSKAYIVRMDTWHTPYHHLKNAPCAVCLAGSVMAKTCEADRTEASYVYDFSVKNMPVFSALDLLRSGAVAEAWRQMFGKGKIGQARGLDRRIMPYSVDATAWWQQMEQLHADLVAADL